MLRPQDIVWVDIPVRTAKGMQDVPHPAVVILDLGNGGYILSNGSTSPGDEPPLLVVPEAAARVCGLPRATAFFRSRPYIWFWRPTDVASIATNNQLLPTYFQQLRAATIATLQDLNVGDIQRLPEEGAGLTLDQLRALLTTTRKR